MKVICRTVNFLLDGLPNRSYTVLLPASAVSRRCFGCFSLLGAFESTTATRAGRFGVRVSKRAFLLAALSEPKAKIVKGFLQCYSRTKLATVAYILQYFQQNCNIGTCTIYLNKEMKGMYVDAEHQPLPGIRRYM